MALRSVILLLLALALHLRLPSLHRDAFARAPAEQQENRLTVRPRIWSLTNDPVVLTAELAGRGEDWLLTATLRFANDCLADSGDVATFLDLPNVTTRIVWIKQVIPEAGCPDFFEPLEVTRGYLMPPDTRLSTLFVLNGEPTNVSDVAGRLQAYERVIGPSLPPPTGLDPTDRPATPMEPMLGSRTPLGILRVRAFLNRDASKRADDLEVDLTVEYPSDCHTRLEHEVLILEGRTSFSDEWSTPLMSWIAPSVADAEGECQDASASTVTGRILFQRSASRYFEHVLVPLVEANVDSTFPLTIEVKPP